MRKKKPTPKQGEEKKEELMKFQLYVEHVDECPPDVPIVRVNIPRLNIHFCVLVTIYVSFWFITWSRKWCIVFE